MYKKILTIALILSILVFTLVLGFPLKSSKGGSSEADFIQTDRCFRVGSLRSYASCLPGHERLSKKDLIVEVTHRVNQITFPFGYLFVFSFALFLGFVIFILATGSDEGTTVVRE